MQKTESPVVKDLVLIGGGHAHVKVLRMFAMQPVTGLRITLIARDIDTPYSGMLPGYVAGHYEFDECHIDLGPLAEFAGARLYHASVTGLDTSNKRVFVKGRPPVSYDLLSINSGSTPHTKGVKGAQEFALQVKPIDCFLLRLEGLLERIKTSNEPMRIVIVGAGAGGVELTLSLQYRVQTLQSTQPAHSQKTSYTLVSRSNQLLPTHHHSVRSRFERLFRQRGIEVHTGCAVVEVTESDVKLETGLRIPAHATIWVTDADAPHWLQNTGISLDEKGFIEVNAYLQSRSHTDIFAAGDVASLPEARPKSGVFAVRQGGVLARNLRNAVLAKGLKKYRAQNNFLSLIGTGDQTAVASRGNWSCEGRWVWWLKDWIDHRFMQKYNDLPEMDKKETLLLERGIADQDAIKELSTLAMRCGGCGAKVGATVLSRVMERLPERQRGDVLIGRNAADDCAMLVVPNEKVMVQSVDYFRAFIADNYLFGAIAANHALGDLFAMGAEPQSALAIATVPYGREKVVEEALYELLAGAVSVLDECDAVLAGGHSSEGAELAFGLSVNGLINPKQVWRKSGLQTGDRLIVTKPIGTGTLFAAAMRRKAKGRWIDAALEHMLQSNQQAAVCLQKYSASACTDLTGFGLVGHLVEMTRASQVDVRLSLESIPLLEGAMNTVNAGILSSLQPQNLRLRRAIRNIERVSEQAVFPLLFDPQTAGGLLAGVPAEHAEDCLCDLIANGYTNASIIGEVVASEEGVMESITVQNYE